MLHPHYDVRAQAFGPIPGNRPLDGELAMLLSGDGVEWSKTETLQLVLDRFVGTREHSCVSRRSPCTCQPRSSTSS